MSDYLHSVFSSPWIRAILFVLGIGLALWLLVRLQAVFSFLLLALLIALLLAPIISWFEDRGIRRSGGIAITLTGAVVPSFFERICSPLQSAVTPNRSRYYL